MSLGMKIKGVGHYLPKKFVTNDALSSFVDTSDEWISSRTGIEGRYFVENENNVSLATNAALRAIAASGIDKNEIGLCIVATFTPDMMMPSTACMVQKQLELPTTVMSFDLHAACSGFVYALQTALGLLSSMQKKYALVIGSEVISQTLDFSDRTTCVLFGDGAGCVVLENSQSHQFVSTFGSSGDEEGLLTCGLRGKADSYLKMQGQDVFRFAIDILPKSIQETLNLADVEIEQVDFFICHQANRRIIERVAKKMNIPIEKFYMNMDHCGNTSAASIPIALSEMQEKGMLKRGMKLLLVGFGAGLTWGSNLIEY